MAQTRDRKCNEGHVRPEPQGLGGSSWAGRELCNPPMPHHSGTGRAATPGSIPGDGAGGEGREQHATASCAPAARSREEHGLIFASSGQAQLKMAICTRKRFSCWGLMG